MYKKIDPTKLDDYPKAPVADSFKTVDGYKDQKTQIDNIESLHQKNTDVKFQ